MEIKHMENIINKNGTREEKLKTDRLTLIKILLCSDLDFVFWKCSRFFLNASSSSKRSPSSSSSNLIPCFVLIASSFISSANGFVASSDSSIGLKVLCLCFCNFGEFEILSVEVSITTVSKLVDVVEFDKVPPPTSGLVLTLLYPCCRGSSYR